MSNKQRAIVVYLSEQELANNQAINDILKLGNISSLALRK